MMTHVIIFPVWYALAALAVVSVSAFLHGVRAEREVWREALREWSAHFEAQRKAALGE